MKIIKVEKAGKFCLNITMQNGDVRLFDVSDSVQSWYRNNSKQLIKIAENFNTAHVDNAGNLAFDCGKDDLFISASEVIEKSKYLKKGKESIRCKSTKSAARGKSHSLGTISSKDVMNTEVNGLHFTGEWRSFLGEPAPNFYMILSASPGHGKTTFCLKFGNYLTKFGRVLYITNEEDAARIKTKFNFIDDKINDFDISFDCKTLDNVIDLIERGNYDFVFIDSAQYGGMDYKELRVVRERFPEIGLIAICRQTKDGKTRGSQEKEYDGDITITFYEQGLARTIKNRFWELSEFQLF